jgi:mono/diheme cytochrome c family protein
MSNTQDNIDYQRTLNVAEAHSAIARESIGNMETKETPIGNLPLILGAIVLLGAGSYIGSNWGSSYNVMGKAYKALPPEGAGDAGPPEDPVVKWKKDGAAVYGQACQGCHGPGGAGNAGSGIPPLAGSEWVTGGEKRLAAVVLKGLSGPITVKGAAYGSAVMNAKGGVNLNDKQVAQVISYIRNEWGNSGSLVMADQIKELNAAIASLPSPMPTTELEKIPAGENLTPSKKPLVAPAAPPAK